MNWHSILLSVAVLTATVHSSERVKRGGYSAHGGSSGGGQQGNQKGYSGGGGGHQGSSGGAGGQGWSGGNQGGGGDGQGWSGGNQGGGGGGQGWSGGNQGGGGQGWSGGNQGGGGGGQGWSGGGGSYQKGGGGSYQSGAYSGEGKFRGTAGVDYPNYKEVPNTSFRCSQVPYVPGMYADEETQCQVYHVCHDGRKESLICGPGTIFNQKILACDYWYSVECDQSSKYYYVNEEIGHGKAGGGQWAGNSGQGAPFGGFGSSGGHGGSGSSGQQWQSGGQQGMMMGGAGGD